VNSNQMIAAERADGIDVVAIISLMWRYRYFIISVSILGGLVAAYIALTAREVFRAEVVVTEVHDNGLSDEKGLGGQLGGLASLAGLNLGPGGGDPSVQGVLASRHLIEEFIKRQELVPLLTAKAGKRATLWFAVKQFQERCVHVHVDDTKGLTTITMDWFDPATAAKWANEFVSLANDIIRTRVLEETTRNVAYLSNQISQTRDVEIQRSLANLIESETKTLMLANGRRDYAFRIVDPAVAPEIRHSPRRTLLVASGAAVGFLVGTFFAFGLDAFRNRKHIR
jgi:LPS O-antigen subunit length determinant protein (WzzB/FepE family)